MYACLRVCVRGYVRVFLPCECVYYLYYLRVCKLCLVKAVSHECRIFLCMSVSGHQLERRPEAESQPSEGRVSGPSNLPTRRPAVRS